jgi:mannose/cellobiose epimerase-like protein (N-acyl-D-glucosamine 2-epimerase family)
MQRRQFIKASLGGSALGLTVRTTRAKGEAPPRSEDAGKLAGLSLEQLRDLYRRYLFEDFLPFMDKYVIDHQYGGFMCNTDLNGANLSTTKNTWYEGRGIWVYSFLYNNFGKQEKHLEVARKSVEFILRVQPSGEELWPRRFARDGKALTPPATEIYGDLFVAEGLAEYLRATGEEKYWGQAKEIILKCLKIYDRPDYEPNIVAEYGGPKPIPFPGARIQGVAMVLIRIISQMLQRRADPELEKILSHSLSAVFNHHYNPAFQLNNELLNHDYSRPNNELSQFVYTGHSIETLWMVLYEAVRTKNRQLFDTAAERFQRHVEVAWDRVYGGVFRSLNNVDQNVWTLDKVLWEQEEVLIGTLCIVEHAGAPWAREMFGKMFSYVRDKFPLQRYGYPLWIVQGDRKVTFDRRPPKGPPFPEQQRVENYHHPRHLMLNLLSLDRMIRRGGATPGLFAERA